MADVSLNLALMRIGAWLIKPVLVDRSTALALRLIWPML